MKIIFGVSYAEKCKEEAQEGWKEGEGTEGEATYESHKEEKEGKCKKEII